MPDALQAARAVNGRGLVQRRVDARERGQVDDRAPADILPDVGGDEDGAEVARVGQQACALHAQHGQHVVDQAVRLAKLRQQAAHDDDGDEVRHVRDRLDDVLIAVVGHLMDHQGEDDGRRERKGDLIQVDQQRVADDAPGVHATQKLGEVVQADEAAAGDAAHGLVVLKRDDRIVHARIVKDDVVEHDRNQHQIDVLIALHPLEQRMAVTRWRLQRPGRARHVSHFLLPDARPDDLCIQHTSTQCACAICQMHSALQSIKQGDLQNRNRFANPPAPLAPPAFSPQAPCLCCALYSPGVTPSYSLNLRLKLAMST